MFEWSTGEFWFLCGIVDDDFLKIKLNGLSRANSSLNSPYPSNIRSGRNMTLYHGCTVEPKPYGPRSTAPGFIKKVIYCG